MRFKFLLSLILLALVSQAQTLPKVIPPSPSTQQFQKYVDYPVGSFTGVPEISVPLYTIVEGDISIPIALNYHASGTKPSDVHGLVGLGWTLSSIGKVGVEILGKPDYSTFPSPNYSVDQLTHLLNWQKEKYFAEVMRFGDTEPDIYTYIINGHMGKFVFSGASPYSALMLPYAPLKIERENGYQGLKVLDENGFIYNLTAGESISDPSYGSLTTSFEISKMTSATDPNNTVTFSNIQSHSETLAKRWDEFTTDDHPSTSSGSSGCGTYSAYDLMDNYPSHNQETKFSFNTYGVVNSGDINFRSGKVKFTQFSSGDFVGMVQKMEIFDKSMILNKTIEFVYAKKTVNKNLLKELNFFDSKHNLVYSYKFDYSHEDYSIPDPYSAGIDHWGYYDGSSIAATGKELFMPWRVTYDEAGRIGTDLNSNAGAHRVTNVEGMKTFVLNKVTFPTGGYSIYDFEANQYGGIPNYSGTDVGGLRVKSITHYNENNVIADKKDYGYGTGIMDIEPGHIEDYSYSEEIMFPEWPMSTGSGSFLPQDWLVFRRRHYRSEPYINLTPKGSPVVYKNVSETYQGSEGVGGISYEFDHTPVSRLAMSTNSVLTNNAPEVLYKAQLIPDKGWKSGNLIRKTISSATGIVKDEFMYYSDMVYEPDSIRAMRFDNFAVYIPPACAGPPSGSGPEYYVHNYVFCSLNYGQYMYLREYHRIDSVVQVNYNSSGGNPVKIATSYQYNNLDHNQITSKIQKLSNGNTVTTNYKYPHDFVGQQPYGDMVNVLHKWSPVIEQLSYKRSNDMLNAIKTNYANWGNGIIQPLSIESKTGNFNYKSKITFQGYDNKGNATSLSQTGGSDIVYLYGYSGKCPVAKVSGSNLSTVSSLIDQGILDTGTEVQRLVQLSALRSYFSSNPSVLVETYTYFPLIGMSSMTDAKGMTTYYEYDSFQRLKYIKDQNGNIVKTFSYNYGNSSTSGKSLEGLQGLPGEHPGMIGSPKFPRK